MYSVTTLIFYALAAEILRRLILVLLTAFTGPLSKIPGPFWSKLWVWIIEVINGNQMNLGPGHFEKYGPIVKSSFNTPFLVLGRLK